MSENDDAKKNTLEEHIVEKYGSINDFINRLHNFNNTGCDKTKITQIIKNPDFLENMQLGMRVCVALRIDFAELFGSESIREVATGGSKVKKSSEERYLRTDLPTRQSILDYMDNILQD